MSHTYTGQITIEPALNWAQVNTVVKGMKALMAKGGGSRYTKESVANGDAISIRDTLGFGMEIEESSRETEDGTLLVKTCPRLSYRSNEDGCYYLNEADIINLVIKAAPKSKLNGVLVMVHEEGTQGTKTTVKDNKVSATSGIAHMRWADGTEEKISTLI